MTTDQTLIDGRYAVEAELGRGAMGHVVSVRDTFAGDVPYACKVLDRPELHHDFVAEFKLLRRLSEPTFVAAYRLGVDLSSRQPFVIMQVCTGDTLMDAPARDDEERLTFAVGLLRALDHLHRHGFVHGDLAPANIVRTDGETGLKILDLGAGGRRGSRRGTTSGVLAYAAPERLDGEPLETTSDLWSLGCVLFETVHGRHPFPGYPATTKGLVSGVGPERSGLSPHLLDPLLDRLLTLKPADRVPSATAALKEIEALTGRAFPLVPVEALAARLKRTPFVDVDGQLDRLEAAVRDLVDRGVSGVHDIDGPPGSGRSRMLDELSMRLAARGIPVVEGRVRPSDGSTDCLRRVMGRWSPESPMPSDIGAAIQAFASTCVAQPGPVAVLVDDIERGSSAAQRGFDELARRIRALPARFPGLVLVTVGTRGRDLALRAWTDGDFERLFEGLFPRRRVGLRVAEPLRAASRGNIGLALAITGQLLETGKLSVDGASVRLSNPDAALAAAPTSLEAAADATLATLPELPRSMAALLAYARGPVPRGLLDLDDLVDAGVAVLAPDPEGARFTLASEPMINASRRQMPAAAAHLALAARWTALDHPDASLAALWHRLNATRSTDDINAFETHLLASSPADNGPLAPLVAFLTDEAWPAAGNVARSAGCVSESSGDVELALTLYRRAAQRGTDDTTRAGALADVGRVEARLSRHAAALTALTDALDVGAATFSRHERAEVLASVARSAVQSGAVDQAETACREGLGVADTDVGLQGRLHYCQGLVGWYRGQMDAAAKAFNAALTASRSVDDQVETAAALTGLGLVAHRRGDLDAALTLYREALTLGEKVGDDARVMTALQNLGVVYHERGDWTDALETYQEALALAEALDHSGRVIQLAGNLGNLWRYLGEFDDAHAVLQRGLRLARQERNRYMEAIVLNLLADVASDREQWSLAERLWFDAIAVATEGGFATEEAEARLNLGRLQLERLAFDEARRSLNTAIAIATKADNATLVAQGEALLAGVASRSVHGSYEAAKRHIDAALAGLSEISNPGGRWPILLQAAEIALDQGRPEEAMSARRDAREILQTQLDAVPAKHREAFLGRRDRRKAWRTSQVPTDHSQDQEKRQDPRVAAWSRLIEVNKRLLGEHDVTRLLEYIMDSAILLTEAERGFLLLAEDAGDQELKVKVARNLDQENIRRKQMKISHGIARRVLATGAAIITIDAMEDERYRDQLSVHDMRLRSVLCLPLSTPGNIMGAIYLDNRFRTSAFSDADTHFMEAFADIAAIALNNATLIASKAAAQKALEASQKKVVALNAKLKSDLKERTAELEDTHRVVIRQQRQLVAKHHYDNIVGDSDAIRRVFAMIDRLLDNDVPVLVEGESGTGKELVARAIHFNGRRRARPFVAVNCGAIPATLLESELFGHVRGAFTGASGDKKGLFEAAHNGTLLLDEIGELPLEMQVKLLRVLQSGEFKKLGSTQEIKVDVRIIAATNRRLEDEVQGGRFRDDLYYRLSVVPIQVPTLRERKEDIPQLVQHFLARNRAAGLGEVTGASTAALALLTGYAWPGNVRQLEMVLKNASVFAEATTLQPHDFESFPDIMGTGDDHGSISIRSLQGKSLAEIEREAIIVALRDNRGNKKRSAEQLGIDRRTLYNKLAAYKIVVEKALKVR